MFVPFDVKKLCELLSNVQPANLNTSQINSHVFLSIIIINLFVLQGVQLNYNNACNYTVHKPESNDISSSLLRKKCCMHSLSHSTSFIIDT